MKSKYTRALVTGGAGFIGSHIVDRLLEKGFEVRVIDDLSTGKLENISVHMGKSNFRFVKGDIRNFETVKTVVSGVEVIFHEAAFVGVPQSIDKPLLTNDVNVNGTLNLLEASLKFDVKRFIYASSAAVYGTQKIVPIREDAIPYPDSPYGVSKLASEYYLKAYHENYDLETVSLRYFNVYGPRQSPSYGLVITAFVDHLTREKSPIIHGDGKQTRDFVNIEDVVDANMLAMEKSHAGEIVCNVATGSSLTINQIFRLLQTIMGKRHIEPIHDAPIPHDRRQSCGDITRANEILGFKPKVSIKKGLTNFLESRKQTVSHC